MTIRSFTQKLLIVIFCIILLHQSITAQQYSLDKLMQEYDMVNIQDLDPTILVELKYSTEDNFVGKDMYGDLEHAYLEKEFANRVVRAQDILRKRNPNYTLLIYDAARPISTQRAMRKIVEGT